MYAPVIFLIESLFMIYIKPQIKYSKLIGDNIPFIHLFLVASVETNVCSEAETTQAYSVFLVNWWMNMPLRL